MLKEEDKLYEQLVQRVETIYKAMPQKKKLSPIGESSTEVNNSQMFKSMRVGGKDELQSSQIATQMKRIVDVKRLEVNGSMFIKSGACETEIPGDRQLIGASLKTKLVHIVFW
jgi:hypothetical protein